VVFTSDAGNLVAGDTNGKSDVFVRDRATSQTTRINVSSGGTQGNAQSNSPVISADGRYVAFTSSADNLVAGDKNAVDDVFVRDLKTGKTRLVSVSSAGVQGSNRSQSDAISADGRYVVFTSEINGEFNPTSVFVRDLKTRTTTVVNSRFGRNWGGRISADGRFVAFTSRKFDRAAQAQLHDRVTGVTIGIVPGGGYFAGDFSHSDAISADGRYVAVVSGNPLVPEDKCEPFGFDDVYLYDRETGKVTGISKITGDEACGYNGSPAVSADGRYVAFT
jgi:Tol biopolymer transport system component